MRLPPLFAVAARAAVLAVAMAGASGAFAADATKAVFYVEDGEKAVGTPGTIVWENRPEAPTPEGEFHGAATFANGVKLDVSMKRNNDAALPASHIIQMSFEAPDEVMVDELPGLLMKATEEGKGVPLTGAAAKAGTGIFLVGLAVQQQAQAVNLQLLTKALWIDVPIKLTNGKRGVVALELGKPGSALLKASLVAWAGKAGKPVAKADPKKADPKKVAADADKGAKTEAAAADGDAADKGAKKADPKKETVKADPAKKPDAAADKKAADPAKTATATVASGGGRHVMLSSQPSEEAARGTFASLQKQYPDLLGGRSPLLVKNDLGDRVLFQVRIETASPAEAKDLCAKLKAKGGTCAIR